MKETTTPVKSLKKVFLEIIFIAMFVMAGFRTSAQKISPYLLGNNYWIPGTNLTEVMKPGGLMDKADFQTIRIGGFGANSYSDTQYLEYIRKIKAMGAIPIVQVRCSLTTQQAINFIRLVNVTNNLNVKMWSIGNEPDHAMGGKLSDSLVADYTKRIAAALKSVDPTIITIGAEYSGYSSSRYANLIGGAFSITGKVPGKDYYYIDVLGFHRYVATDASDFMYAINDLIAKMNVENLKRPDGKKLKWGMGEFNSHYNNDMATNPDEYVWSYNNGQMHAELYGVGMQKEAFMLASWCALEGQYNRQGTDLSLFDKDFVPRSSYWHSAMLGQNRKKNYLQNTDNQSKVAIVPMGDATGTSVMIINKNKTAGYSYSVKLDMGTVSANALTVNVNAGINKEVKGSIGAYTTQMLVFNSSGDLTKIITYSKSHADNRLEPTTTIINTVAPVVSFTQPLNNTTYKQGDSLVVNVTASHSSGIQNVQLFLNGVFVRQETIAPYDWGLGTGDAMLKNLAAGKYTLKAIATSVSGLTSEASIAVIVNAPVNLPPSITLTAPLANASFTAPASIAIAATANDADGIIQNVSFYQGNTLLGSDASAPYSFTWTNVAAGTYAITAKATDDKGATTISSVIPVTVIAIVLPVVSFTQPLNNTTYKQGDSLVVNVTASHSSGIQNVQLFLNGVFVRQENIAPYDWGLGTGDAMLKNLAAGNYTLKAIATSVSGLTSEASISVIVNAPVNLPPSVTLTAPLANASFTTPASIAIAATANDADGTIQSVSFYQGNTLLGTDASAPYSFAWNNVAAGTYAITAKATDNKGATTISSVIPVTVIAIVPPVVSFTQPLNNTTYKQGDSLVVNVAASHSSGIQNVQLFLNGVFVRQENIAPYDWGLGTGDVMLKNLAAGNYTLKAIATSVSGLTSEASIAVIVNAPVNLPPSVTLTAPLANASFTSPASIAIAATANDADGIIQNVSFYQGNTLLGSDASAPYSFTWTNVAAGTYAITAKATDDKGATATSNSITIIVNPEPIATADILGADCGTLNTTLTYEVSLSNRTNATSYSWWMNGYIQSVTPVSGSSYKVIVQTGLYFTGGQLCVGVNYSVAPYYSTFCKAITSCTSTVAPSNTSIYPNPSDNAFTLTAKENISSVTVTNYNGNVVFTHGIMAAGEILVYGNTLSSGLYAVVIVYANGNIETQKIQKL